MIGRSDRPAHMSDRPAHMSDRPTHMSITNAHASYRTLFKFRDEQDVIEGYRALSSTTPRSNIAMMLISEINRTSREEVTFGCCKCHSPTQGILLTKITAAVSFHRARVLYLLAVIFAATIALHCKAS